MVLTGEAGTGKTTPLHKLLDRLKQRGRSSAYVFHAILEPVELLQFNLETPRGKLLQIILAGQPELDDKLRLPALRPLRQRAIIHSRLALLSEQEIQNIAVDFDLLSAPLAVAERQFETHYGRLVSFPHFDDILENVTACPAPTPVEPIDPIPVALFRAVQESPEPVAHAAYSSPLPRPRRFP